MSDDPNSDLGLNIINYENKSELLSKTLLGLLEMDSCLEFWNDDSSFLFISSGLVSVSIIVGICVCLCGWMSVRVGMCMYVCRGDFKAILQNFILIWFSILSSVSLLIWFRFSALLQHNSRETWDMGFYIYIVHIIANTIDTFTGCFGI